MRFGHKALCIFIWMKNCIFLLALLALLALRVEPQVTFCKFTLIKISTFFGAEIRRLKLPIPSINFQELLWLAPIPRATNVWSFYLEFPRPCPTRSPSIWPWVSICQTFGTFTYTLTWDRWTSSSWRSTSWSSTRPPSTLTTWIRVLFSLFSSYILIPQRLKRNNKYRRYHFLPPVSQYCSKRPKGLPLDPMFFRQNIFESGQQAGNTGWLRWTGRNRRT